MANHLLTLCARIRTSVPSASRYHYSHISKDIRKCNSGTYHVMEPEVGVGQRDKSVVVSLTSSIYSQQSRPLLCSDMANISEEMLPLDSRILVRVLVSHVSTHLPGINGRECACIAM